MPHARALAIIFIFDFTRTSENLQIKLFSFFTLGLYGKRPLTLAREYDPSSSAFKRKKRTTKDIHIYSVFL